MKKQNKKLNLKSETVRSLTNLQLAEVAGGLPRLSKNATDCCGAPGSDHVNVCQSEFASDCGSCG